MQILETEFEAVEQTKAEVSGLQNGKLSELAAKAFPAYKFGWVSICLFKPKPTGSATVLFWFVCCHTL